MEKSLLKNHHAQSVEQIIYARHKQYERYNCSDMHNGTIQEFSAKNTFLASNDALALAKSAGSRLQLSPRAYLKVIKVARTIADIDKSSSVEVQHISEALQFCGRF